MIKRGFKNKTRAVMLPLYKAIIVRSHLDYCIQAWRDVDGHEGHENLGIEKEGNNPIAPQDLPLRFVLSLLY